MNINLQNKIALVTGSSGGIGAAIAGALARCGAKVAVNGLHNMDRAEEVVTAIRDAGGEAAAFQADVTDTNAIESMVGEITLRFGGPIDLLINNAGHLVERSPIETMSEELYSRIMDVNLKSAVFVSKAVIPGMKAAGGGRIINLTSVAAHNGGGPGAAIYAASKAAVIALTKGLAKELSPGGITVNALSPGFIGQTAFHATFTSAEGRSSAVSSIPLGREGTPDDVAGAALYLCSELGSFITGETIEINGGMYMR
ncbi:SDR family NAD(P)-dependent oxidoreductase [Paenibacillus sp. 276b]|uniref:SDR family NAD(P)-dependent oxidoreductase n=1 Tax=Paenibacillus sp. 276b TaxID=1566277 RepID=UPI0008998498|nr:glucose 1-dehydrogenase [Paenibacillus sp. 276b]SEB03486.1 3-oxoacyl-[acyl-carrier protein] reductase [Paenibacillus sp. 276b]